MIKAKDEVIRSMNELKINQNREVADMKEQLSKYEDKVKREHADVLTNLHNIHKAETDSLRAKIKQVENDLANKDLELKKTMESLYAANKEQRLRGEDAISAQRRAESLQESLEKTKGEIASYVNRLENSEIVIQNLREQNKGLTRQNATLSVEKQGLIEENRRAKSSFNEIQTKLSGLSSSLKKIENERNSKGVEIEKRDIEIQNLKAQVNELLKSKQQDKLSLNDDLNAKKCEISELRTKVSILTVERENNVAEISSLNQKLGDMEISAGELEEEIEELKETVRLAREREVVAENDTKELKVINEPMRVTRGLLTFRVT